MALRPRFAAAILDGTKTVELRRRRIAVPTGSLLVLYSSSPEKALIGTARLDALVADEPDRLWPHVASRAGISHAEYGHYAAGASVMSALVLTDALRLSRGVTLATLRTACGDFTVPQSYRYLGAEELKAIGDSCVAGAELLNRAIDHATV
jgi:predicted transcriptional regulator